MISLCLDQSTPIQAERLRTAARGTTDYSHQQQICETTPVLLQYLECNSVILPSLSAYLWDLQVDRGFSRFANVETFLHK